LGLFLVPRELDGRPNGFQLRRLKIKLGTRSMPTGEIEFDGAAAEPIGDLGAGFRNLVGIVLDTSRYHNAVAACGLIRRAFTEARAYARRRVAFGHPIITYPSVQRILAEMKLRSRAALATTFRLLDQTDRVDTGRGDGALLAARRIGVMVNKYWTAIQATRAARDGIEILGGNGTIEDFSILPRLYRDAIVIESWEGTHNTLCAQVLRDFKVRDLHRPWLDQIAREVDEIRTAGVGDSGEVAGSLLDDLRRRIERLVDAEQITAAAWIRDVVDRMAVLTDWVSLATQAAWESRRDLDTGTADVLALYRRLELDTRDRMDDVDRTVLEAKIAT
ncbi:MAG: acyl-CoA dehydrogenase family protein, partial [Holophagae bacterium]